MKKTQLCIAIIGLIFNPALSLKALTIDFEKGEGYEEGVSPVGHVEEDYSWSGKSGFGEIVPREGFDDTSSLRLPPVGDFASLELRPAWQEIPERMHFSVMVKLEALRSESFQVPLRLRLAVDGDAEACRVHFYEGGKIEFFSAEKIHRAKNEYGADFLLREGVYSRLDVWLDFQNNTYRLAIDDVEQTVEGEKNIPFMKNLPRNGLGRFQFTNSHNTVGGVHIDSIKWVKDE